MVIRLDVYIKQMINISECFNFGRKYTFYRFCPIPYSLRITDTDFDLENIPRYELSDGYYEIAKYSSATIDLESCCLKLIKNIITCPCQLNLLGFWS